MRNDIASNFFFFRLCTLINICNDDTRTLATAGSFQLRRGGAWSALREIPRIPTAHVAERARATTRRGDRSTRFAPNVQQQVAFAVALQDTYFLSRPLPSLFAVPVYVYFMRARACVRKMRVSTSPYLFLFCKFSKSKQQQSNIIRTCVCVCAGAFSPKYYGAPNYGAPHIIGQRLVVALINKFY